MFGLQKKTVTSKCGVKLSRQKEEQGAQQT
jgi:hypothetical protein